MAAFCALFDVFLPDRSAVVMQVTSSWWMIATERYEGASTAVRRRQSMRLTGDSRYGSCTGRPGLHRASGPAATVALRGGQYDPRRTTSSTNTNVTTRTRPPCAAGEVERLAADVDLHMRLRPDRVHRPGVPPVPDRADPLRPRRHDGLATHAEDLREDARRPAGIARPPEGASTATPRTS